MKKYYFTIILLLTIYIIISWHEVKQNNNIQEKQIELEKIQDTIKEEIQKIKDKKIEIVPDAYAEKKDPIISKKETVEKKVIVSISENTKVEKEHKYYFTNYDLWDVWQNDATPCIWASGKDICWMYRQWIKTIALVNLKRWEMWINFGDKVELKWWLCDWIYQVEDEMNWRFRQKTPVYKPWTTWEIRWDIARYWNKNNCGWVYNITKI